MESTVYAGSLTQEEFMRKTFTVIRQDWLESERGWGTSPDGYSLHLTRDDLAKYISAYWARMPDSVPDEYSRPEGEPVEIKVDKATYNKVKSSPHGVRY